MPHHLPAATAAAPTAAVALSRSARLHAYALILLASATALTISGTTAFTLYATPIPAHIAALAADTARTTTVLAATWWLLHLMTRRAVDQPGHRPIPAGARGCSVLIAAAALVLNTVADPGTGTWARQYLAVAALFVALTLAVAREHGISPARLGICPPGARTSHGRAQALAVGADAMTTETGTQPPSATSSAACSASSTTASRATNCSTKRPPIPPNLPPSLDELAP